VQGRRGTFSGKKRNHKKRAGKGRGWILRTGGRGKIRKKPPLLRGPIKGTRSKNS